MKNSIKKIIRLKDPVDSTLERWSRPNGLKIKIYLPIKRKTIPRVMRLEEAAKQPRREPTTEQMMARKKESLRPM